MDGWRWSNRIRTWRVCNVIGIIYYFIFSQYKISNFIFLYIFRCSPDVNVSPSLNQLVIENMLRLPGLSTDTLLQAIKGNTFDHVSAIYNLLVDRLEPTMPNLPSIQSIPGDYLPDGAHQLEKVIIF